MSAPRRDRETWPCRCCGLPQPASVPSDPRRLLPRDAPGREPIDP